MTQLKLILVLAKKDLQMLLGSFAGYLLLSAYALLVGLLFYAYGIGRLDRDVYQVIDRFLFLTSGVTTAMCLVISARALIEEKLAGCFELLYTSRLGARGIICGKFIALSVVLALMLLTTLPLIFLIGLSSNLPLGALIGGYLGLFMLGCAVMSLGLLASVMAVNLFSANVLATAMVSLLLIMWLPAQISSQPWRYILHYLALYNTHFSVLASGTINAMDVTYYFSVITLALGASTIWLNSRRWWE